MASFAKTQIVGYLGRDVELRHTPQGDAVANFSMATSRRTKKDGEWTETTLWWRVTVWGRTAENCNQYLSKGSQVYADGRPGVDEYTDRDGNQRFSLTLDAQEIQFLGSKGDGEPRESRNDDRDAKRAAMTAQAPAKPKQGTLPGAVERSGYADPGEDDIPF